MQKRFLALLTALLLLAMPALAQEKADISTSVYTPGEIETTEAEQEAGNPIFVITMTDGTVMRGELYPEIAPHSVGNFIALSNSGFYDGLIFHRVIPGFVIQAGDPNGDGTGGPGWNILGEFSLNGIENDITHTEGVLSMARRSQPLNSGGSQFFVVVGDATFLDGQYAGFGKVLIGVDEAIKIANVPVKGEKPVEDQVIQSIRVETFGKEYPFDQM